jgi:hypothetical protein
VPERLGLKPDILEALCAHVEQQLKSTLAMWDGK